MHFKIFYKTFFPRVEMCLETTSVFKNMLTKGPYQNLWQPLHLAIHSTKQRRCHSLPAVFFLSDLHATSSSLIRSRSPLAGSREL